MVFFVYFVFVRYCPKSNRANRIIERMNKNNKTALYKVEHG